MPIWNSFKCWKFPQVQKETRRNKNQSDISWEVRIPWMSAHYWRMGSTIWIQIMITGIKFHTWKGEINGFYSRSTSIEDSVHFIKGCSNSLSHFAIMLTNSLDIQQTFLCQAFVFPPVSEGVNWCQESISAPVDRRLICLIVILHHWRCCWARWEPSARLMNDLAGRKQKAVLIIQLWLCGKMDSLLLESIKIHIQ